MAGIFGLFDFTRPGKGVDKDTPEKHPFFLFFELVWRKLGRLVLLNVIYFIAILPLVTAVYFLVTAGLLGSAAQAGLDPAEFLASPLPSVLLGVATALPAPVNIALLALSILAYGPATCGLTFMLRNFTRQQHAWNSDFFDKFKQNFKQGVIFGVLDVAVLSLLVFNLVQPAGGAPLTTVARYVSIPLLVIYLFMRNYIPLMTVTFHLGVMQLLKNAWIFAVIGLPRNLLVLVVNGVLLVGLAVYVPLGEIALFPLFLFAFMGFVSVFTCYPVVKKYMIDPQNKSPEGEGELALAPGEDGEK
ncbi:MAG: DUF624 domain-containing protein [Oscillospiraceae bacterium]|jgi:uncharacterized membrane protein YesL|nr:DUF624 domain-containing protein [Oscillospiraceae bacterium]